MMYPENILFRADRAYPIDFNGCGYGYYPGQPNMSPGGMITATSF